MLPTIVAWAAGKVRRNMYPQAVAVRYVLGFVALILCSVPLIAAGEDWHEELTLQIDHDEDCDVNFMSQVVERIVNGQRVIMAKVHCKDKRTFDAYRGSDDEAFQFKACEVPNAESC